MKGIGKTCKSLTLALALVVVWLPAFLAALPPSPAAGAEWPPVAVEMSIEQAGTVATATLQVINKGDFDIDVLNVRGQLPRGASYLNSWGGSGPGFNPGVFNGTDVSWTDFGLKSGGREGPFVYMFDTSGMAPGSTAEILGWVGWGGRVPGNAVSSPMAVRASSGAGAPSAAPASAPTLEWFGWSHFRLTTVDGLVILINPFITGNPDASVKVEDITKADVILAADGHRDEQGDSIVLAQNTGAKLIGGGFELGSWFIQQGVPASQVIRTSPGDRHRFGGVTIRVVGSVHGSGLPQPTIENPYGGPAAGFMITLENGFTVYFAGSTAATMDMQLWGSAFKPDIAILPLNPTRDPIDVAQMVRLLRIDNPNLARVIPHHHRVEPQPGATTVGEMADAVHSMVGASVNVMEMQRGQAVPLVK